MWSRRRSLREWLARQARGWFASLVDSVGGGPGFERPRAGCAGFRCGTSADPRSPRSHCWGRSPASSRSRPRGWLQVLVIVLDASHRAITRARELLHDSVSSANAARCRRQPRRKAPVRRPEAVRPNESRVEEGAGGGPAAKFSAARLGSRLSSNATACRSLVTPPAPLAGEPFAEGPPPAPSSTDPQSPADLSRRPVCCGTSRVPLLDGSAIPSRSPGQT